ncbi:MAG: hypothetical protein KatS3mg087_1647 [Patescibacteria group bacterium]|nr:MAG: hypothetical protein KatS3mg087_1647 [Patescibacteria group bacterium]
MKNRIIGHLAEDLVKRFDKNRLAIIIKDKDGELFVVDKNDFKQFKIIPQESRLTSYTNEYSIFLIKAIVFLFECYWNGKVMWLSLPDYDLLLITDLRQIPIHKIEIS